MFSLYFTPSENLLAHENISNDLVLLESNGAEMGRHEGYRQESNSLETHRRNANIANCKGFISWFKGRSSLCLLNLADFSYRELKNMIPYSEGLLESQLLQVVHSEDMMRFFFLFEVDKVVNCGVYVPPMKEPALSLLAEKFDKCTLE